MWHDHPFSKRNKTTERAVGVGVEHNRKEGGHLKKGGGRQYGGGLHKIGGLAPLCQLCAKKNKGNIPSDNCRQ